MIWEFSTSSKQESHDLHAATFCCKIHGCKLVMLCHSSAMAVKVVVRSIGFHKRFYARYVYVSPMFYEPPCSVQFSSMRCMAKWSEPSRIFFVDRIHGGSA